SSVHGIWVLGLLFAANFCSGFGVMVLDISIAAIFGVVIPAEMRSRVSGAFQAINYGTRPLGALLGGWIGTMVGLRPTLWIAVAGGVVGSLLLLPSPLPQFRMPPLARRGARPPGPGPSCPRGLRAGGGPAGSRGRACCRGRRARPGHCGAGRLPGQ